VKIFAGSRAPLSVPGVLASHKELTKVNKTTLYREVDFLTRQNILTVVTLGDGKARYELVDQTHHHHLVCEDCGRISDVELTEDLESEERRIKKEYAFTVRRHSLEFFGQCSDCH
jgi:Fe2+ or Zn2+ uptake regulation protein